MNHLSKLIDIGSPSIGTCIVRPIIPEGLKPLHVAKNGFYAFESALLVRHIGDPAKPKSCIHWNAVEAWKDIFNAPPVGICFAENLFGEQYVLNEGVIWHFDPETSENTYLAASLEEWAEIILDDYDYRTGHLLGKKWQAHFGPLPRGTKLIPKIPFVLGGEFELSNLKAVEECTAMRVRAAIANQIRELPDGSRIEISLVE